MKRPAAFPCSGLDRAEIGEAPAARLQAVAFALVDGQHAYRHCSGVDSSTS